MVWVPAFLIRCSRGKNGKYEFIFILFFAPSISSNTFLLPAPLKYGSARSGQKLRQHPFLFFLLTNTSLKTEISSIYKSLLCRFLDLFYITRSGVSQRVIPLNATPGICSAKGYHSENVMLFQNLVPFVAEKISVDLRARELWCRSVNVAISIWTTTTPAVERHGVFPSSPQLPWASMRHEEFSLSGETYKSLSVA